MILKKIQSLDYYVFFFSSVCAQKKGILNYICMNAQCCWDIWKSRPLSSANPDKLNIAQFSATISGLNNNATGHLVLGGFL